MYVPTVHCRVLSGRAELGPAAQVLTGPGARAVRTEHWEIPDDSALRCDANSPRESVAWGGKPDRACGTRGELTSTVTLCSANTAPQRRGPLRNAALPRPPPCPRTVFPELGGSQPHLGSYDTHTESWEAPNVYAI